MLSAISQAIDLMLSGDPILLQIIVVTLQMSVASSLIALCLGVPFGVFLATRKSKLKTIPIVLNRTMMGLPPVVCGLFCYLMFCGVGPLRGLELLYTVPGMVVAQVLLITPVVAGNMEAFVNNIAEPIRETACGLGLSPLRSMWMVMSECRYQVITVYLLAFGRAIAEVGAVTMVGGAVAHKTNVMTTAIMMYTNRGDFTLGIALGIILLSMFLVLNVGVGLFQMKVSK